MDRAFGVPSEKISSGVELAGTNGPVTVGPINVAKTREESAIKQPNRIQAAMRAGRKAFGYNLSFPSPWVIDILGKIDFDFVFIDGEHGPFGLDQLEDLCRTAERYRVTTIARVPD